MARRTRRTMRKNATRSQKARTAMAKKSESQRFAMEEAFEQARIAATRSKAKSYKTAKAWVRRNGTQKMQALLSGPTGSAAAREFRQSLLDFTDPKAADKMHAENIAAGYYNPKKKKRSTSFGERLPKLLQGLEEEDYVVHRGDAYGQPGVWMVTSEDGWRFDLVPVKGQQSGSYQMWALPKGKTEMATMRSHPLYKGRNSFGTQSSAGAKGIIHALSLPYGSVPGSRFARKNAPIQGSHTWPWEVGEFELKGSPKHSIGNYGNDRGVEIMVYQRPKGSPWVVQVNARGKGYEQHFSSRAAALQGVPKTHAQALQKTAQHDGTLIHLRKNAPKGGAGSGAKAFWRAEEREELTPRIKEVLQLAAGAKALSKFYSSAGKEYDYDTHKSQKYRATAKARLAEGKRMAHDEDLAQSYYHRMWKEIEHKLAYRKLDARHIETVIAQTGRKLKSKQPYRKPYTRNRSHRSSTPARCPFTGQFMSSRSRRRR